MKHVARFIFSTEKHDSMAQELLLSLFHIKRHKISKLYVYPTREQYNIVYT